MDDKIVCEVVKFIENRPVWIWHHTYFSSCPIQSHWHPDIEINVLDEGEGWIDFYINGRHEVLKKGGLCFINSGDVHSSIPSLKCKGDKFIGYTLIISYEFLKTVIPGLESVYWCLDNEDVKSKIIHYMQEIVHIYKNDPDILTNIRLTRLVCSIMEILCETCMYYISDAPLEERKNSERIRNILDYIHSNYQYPLIQEDVARRFYFSRGYFSGFFKKYTGKTFKVYLTEVRLIHAEQMLKESGKSISQIAQDTGFNDERRLIETFKKYYQVTPGAYRKNINKGCDFSL